MATGRFEAGDVVRVPFPYTDRSTRQWRPALIVSDGNLGDDGALLWVLMITSAENRGWRDDIEIEDGGDVTGLPIPSIVRPAKIATVEAGDAERIGRVAPSTMAMVKRALRRNLGWATSA